ncbi:MAG: hypothetical protein JFR38_08935 [Muribaculaceae bacterium]|nr:hypothetical protein [Muribaculaceae bacterium]
MNVAKEPLSETSAKIVVKLDEADYKDKVNAELKRIGQTHVIPGFRKGHVSIDQLRRRFGREVKSDIINREAAHAVYDFIEKEGIHALGNPLALNVTEINLTDKDYTFEYEIALAPEIDIKLDKSVTLPFYTIAVDDKMVEEQDKGLREQFGAQVPGDEVDAKALVKGTIMQLDADGNVITTEDAIQVLDGIVAPFTFSDKSQADLFMGKKVGDKVRFNPAATAGEDNLAEVASMLHISKEAAADVKGDFEMSISEIIVARPAELGEEYYTNVFGPDKVHNEEEYKQALTNMIAGQLRPNSEAFFSDDAHKYLINTYGDITLPLDTLKRILKANNPEEFNDENVDERMEQMVPGLKWQLISDAVCKTLGVKVEEADLLARAVAIARQQFAQYGMYNIDDETVTDAAKRFLANDNFRERIYDEVRNGKMYYAIRQAVTADEKTVSLDEFKALVDERNKANEAE